MTEIGKWEVNVIVNNLQAIAKQLPKGPAALVTLMRQVALFEPPVHLVPAASWTVIALALFAPPSLH